MAPRKCCIRFWAWEGWNSQQTQVTDTEKTGERAAGEDRWRPFPASGIFSNHNSSSGIDSSSLVSGIDSSSLVSYSSTEVDRQCNRKRGVREKLHASWTGFLHIGFLRAPKLLFHPCHGGSPRQKPAEAATVKNWIGQALIASDFVNIRWDETLPIKKRGARVEKWERTNSAAGACQVKSTEGDVKADGGAKVYTGGWKTTPGYHSTAREKSGESGYMRKEKKVRAGGGVFNGVSRVLGFGGSGVGSHICCHRTGVRTPWALHKKGEFHIILPNSQNYIVHHHLLKTPPKKNKF